MAKPDIENIVNDINGQQTNDQSTVDIPARSEAPVSETFKSTAPLTPSVVPSTTKGSKTHLLVESVMLIALVVASVLYIGALNDKKAAEKEVASTKSQLVTLQQNPLLVAQRKTDETIKAVSRLTAVPSDDTPTVSEVSDAEAVKKSIVGLTDVQNGDKLLFYVKGAKFIQYRPSTDKIILNQPLNVR